MAAASLPDLRARNRGNQVVILHRSERFLQLLQVGGRRLHHGAFSLVVFAPGRGFFLMKLRILQLLRNHQHWLLAQVLRVLVKRVIGRLGRPRFPGRLEEGVVVFLEVERGDVLFGGGRFVQAGVERSAAWFVSLDSGRLRGLLWLLGLLLGGLLLGRRVDVLDYVELGDAGYVHLLGRGQVEGRVLNLLLL